MRFNNARAPCPAAVRTSTAARAPIGHGSNPDDDAGDLGRQSWRAATGLPFRGAITAKWQGRLLSK
jgi:hypothetical protein